MPGNSWGRMNIWPSHLHKTLKLTRLFLQRWDQIIYHQIGRQFHGIIDAIIIYPYQSNKNLQEKQPFDQKVSAISNSEGGESVRVALFPSFNKHQKYNWKWHGFAEPGLL